MKRQTELRKVSQEKPINTSLKSVTSGYNEHLPVMTFERNIMSTLEEMERMMEESFMRPFFGKNMLPSRHLFHGIGSHGEVTPAVDIIELEGEVVVKAELPGMKREDITLKISDNNLIISGEKRTEETVERKDYLRIERSHGLFKRVLSLPEGCSLDHVKATYKEGVLEVRIPKTEKRGVVRRIEVE